MLNKNIAWLWLSVFILMQACQTNSSTKQADKTTNSNNRQLVELEYLDGGVPKSEKGITIVSKDGWTKDQMDFQQRYCESMFENLGKEYDAIKFCMCFLDKVQYYYDPIYVREAYEDQKKWNSYCLNEAAI